MVEQSSFASSKKYRLLVLGTKHQNWQIEISTDTLKKRYGTLLQGFDQMIEAAHSGLPVDMGQVSQFMFLFL